MSLYSSSAQNVRKLSLVGNEAHYNQHRCCRLKVLMIQIHFGSCPDQRAVISLVEYHGDEHSVTS